MDTDISLPTADLRITELIWQAGTVVQLVIFVLIAMSVVSLAIVLFKYLQVKRINKTNRRFLDFFWESESLESLFQARDRFRNTALARIFNRAYRAFKALPSQHGRSAATSESLLHGGMADIERLIENAVQREVAELERLLPFLATTASSAPFIGLFGTVWGIMGSFLNIGAKGSTSLAVVAPGIAEALIATAMGLFAAIPAVIFYNLLRNRIRLLHRDFSGFGVEVIHLMVRDTMASRQDG